MSEKLVRMANQIAGFFATQPGAQKAQGVANHLNDFWEPNMRATLVRLDPERSDLHPLVIEALPLINRPLAS